MPLFSKVEGEKTKRCVEKFLFWMPRKKDFYEDVVSRPVVRFDMKSKKAKGLAPGPHS